MAPRKKTAEAPIESPIQEEPKAPAMINQQCKVNITDQHRMGTFANAFRILPDTGDEVLIDFLVFSKQENQAEVVARIRVHKNFLLTIRNRIGVALGVNPEIVMPTGLAN